MRKYFIILLLLLPTLSQGQGVVSVLANLAAKQGNGIYVPPIIPPDTPHTYSSVKNIKAISSVSNHYDAFGFVDTLSDGNVVGVWREGINHLEHGRSFYRFYDKNAQTWGVKTYFDDTLSTTASYFGRMDNWGGTFKNNGKDSLIVFQVLSYNALDSNCDWSTYNYFVKAGYDTATKTLSWNPKREVFIRYDTALNGRNRGTAFGHITKRDDTPGHYLIMYYDWNQDAGTNFRTSALLTNNYFATSRRVTVLENSIFSEGGAAYAGKGRIVAGLRTDASGNPVGFVTSEDRGETWTDRGLSDNLGIQGGLGITIPFLYAHDTLIDVWYADRGATTIAHSDNNTFAQFSTYGKYGRVLLNEPKVWAYNNGLTGFNPSLGYVSTCKLSDTTTLVVYAKELPVFANGGVDSVIHNGRPYGPCPTGNFVNWPSEADLMYSVNDGKDINAFPLPMDSIKNNIPYASSTAALIEIHGMTEASWQNIHGIECDLSSVSDFSSFDSAAVIVGYPENYKELIHNYHFYGYAYAENLISFFYLIPNHTYYVRMRTYNGSGVSAWRQTSFTTKP